MESQNRCFFETLKLKNYRSFADLALSFNQRLTVLVAPNGGGKTAVLDGIAVALRLFVDTMEGKASKGFGPKDIRLVLSPGSKMELVTPVRLEARGQFLGNSMAWARELPREEQSRTTTVEAWQLKDLASRLSRENTAWAERKAANPPLFPLVAYYGTGRLWNIGKLTDKKRTRETAPNARHRGYTDCLSSSSHYKSFSDWFRRFSYEAKQDRSETDKSPHEPQRVLTAVRSAVDIALRPSGWQRLDWDFAEDFIIAHHEDYGRLPVDFLSDGIRNMIGLVADMSHRAARLNPHLEDKAAVKTPGIVLVDEVDMHLHPEWQQVVLRSLLEAFPLVQFIVTTHSPQVLTTVRKENIRILACDEDGKWTAREPEVSALAHESGDALAQIMGTHPRPEIPDILAAIHDYERLVRAGRGDSEEARQIKTSLDAFGFEFSDADKALMDFLTRKARISGVGNS